MRGPPAWPLRLLVRRGQASRVPWARLPPTRLGSAPPWGVGPGLLAGGGTARGPHGWAGGCPGGGAGGPAGGAGLSRLLALWARPPGPSNWGASAGPSASRLLRAGFPSGPAVGARAGGEAKRRPDLRAAAATPRHDPPLQPAAAGRSEAQKLLRLAHPERRRLAGRAAPPPASVTPRPRGGEVLGPRERGNTAAEGPWATRNGAEGRGGLSPGHFLLGRVGQSVPRSSVVKPFRPAGHQFTELSGVCFLSLTRVIQGDRISIF